MLFISLWIFLPSLFEENLAKLVSPCVMACLLPDHHPCGYESADSWLDCCPTWKIGPCDVSGFSFLWLCGNGYLGCIRGSVVGDVVWVQWAIPWQEGRSSSAAIFGQSLYQRQSAFLGLWDELYSVCVSTAGPMIQSQEGHHHHCYHDWRLFWEGVLDASSSVGSVFVAHTRRFDLYFL